MRVIIVIIIMLVAGISNSNVKAQPLQCSPNTAGVLNNVTSKKHIPSRTATPYPNVREADIMWEKWVWRTLNLREKMNHKFYYPFEPTNNRVNLYSIIKCGIEKGELTVYDPSEGDDFGVQLTADQALSIGSRVDTISVPDLYDSDIMHDTVVYTKLNPQDIQEYRIKEVWFFNRQRSVMECRILAICPVLDVYNSDHSEFKGRMEMYWIYFPDLRNLLVNYQAYNRFNDSGPLSYDDVFTKRMFASYVYKESNVYDRNINDYKTGMDALLESERVKTDILNFEHDLWDW